MWRAKLRLHHHGDTRNKNRRILLKEDEALINARKVLGETQFNIDAVCMFRPMSKNHMEAIFQARSFKD